MQTQAVLLTKPWILGVETLRLADPGPRDVVVEITHSGISTGTERLIWSGDMPAFPGMGYPLVPGYEATGEVVEAGADTGFRPGDRVFVPGASTYLDARGIFGAAARRIVTDCERVTRIDGGLGPAGALLALAATARHAIAGPHATTPELIVGHGVLGRLIARQTIAAGAPPPVVWETNAARQPGATGYEVLHPEDDPRADYGTILDASGDIDLLDALIGRIARGGEITLAGFYARPVTFAFPPAFMKEARLRIAAEWTAEDMQATCALIDVGALSLDGLISHTRPASDATSAYEAAFSDPACLKMILDWTAST